MKGQNLALIEYLRKRGGVKPEKLPIIKNRYKHKHRANIATISEAAEICNVSRTVLENAVSSGVVPIMFWDAGKRYLDLKQVDAFAWRYNTEAERVAKRVRDIQYCATHRGQIPTIADYYDVCTHTVTRLKRKALASKGAACP